MTPRTFASLFTAATLSACVVVDGDDGPTNCPDGKCDGSGPEQVCRDPRYGDGTCNVQLACSVPDIDCFQQFTDDASAAAWWASNQMRIAGQNFPIVPPTDPRFARVRASLDTGWAAFRTHRSVGKLRDARPALVIVDKPMQLAAFVAGDAQNNTQPFVVFVETPSLELDLDDSALLGTMMHELQHAVGLHLIGDTRDRIRTYYSASAGHEPLGRDQADDVAIRKLGEAWKEAAGQIGTQPRPELDALPLGGLFYQWLDTVVSGSLQAHPAECMHSVQLLGEVQHAVTAATDLLDGTLAADVPGLASQVAKALLAVRNECLATFTPGVIEVAAAVAHVTPEQLAAAMSPEDRALVANKHFIDGLGAIARDRAVAMRALEAQFTAATGEAWSALRYFSTEEDADDVSTFVMRGAHQDPTGMSLFFKAMLPPAVAQACTDKLRDGLPGYGADLTDEHHATCWRIGHQQRLADDLAARTLPAAPIRLVGPIPTVGRIPGPPAPAGRITN